MYFASFTNIGNILYILPIIATKIFHYPHLLQTASTMNIEYIAIFCKKKYVAIFDK